jgi:O6-methylguanine-DNA--protein-cysteine methyltransferase
MKYFTHADSPLGTMLLVANGSSLTGLYFVGQKYVAEPSEDWIQSEVAHPFQDAKRQLAEYFSRRTASIRSASELRRHAISTTRVECYRRHPVRRNGQL